MCDLQAVERISVNARKIFDRSSVLPGDKTLLEAVLEQQAPQ
jgi:hypothetical protein